MSPVRLRPSRSAFIGSGPFRHLRDELVGHRLAHDVGRSVARAAQPQQLLPADSAPVEAKPASRSGLRRELAGLFERPGVVVHVEVPERARRALPEHHVDELTRAGAALEEPRVHHQLLERGGEAFGAGVEDVVEGWTLTDGVGRRLVRERGEIHEVPHVQPEEHRVARLDLGEELEGGLGIEASGERGEGRRHPVLPGDVVVVPEEVDPRLHRVVEAALVLLHGGRGQLAAAGRGSSAPRRRAWREHGRARARGASRAGRGCRGRARRSRGTSRSWRRPRRRGRSSWRPAARPSGGSPRSRRGRTSPRRRARRSRLPWRRAR